jgi:hypothetical protein
MSSSASSTRCDSTATSIDVKAGTRRLQGGALHGDPRVDSGVFLLACAQPPARSPFPSPRCRRCTTAISCEASLWEYSTRRDPRSHHTLSPRVYCDAARGCQSTAEAYMWR